MENLISSIVEENRKYVSEGKVATYIPELGKTDPNLLGIAMIDNDYKIYTYGDYQRKFTIQSMSKPLTLILALLDNGEKVFEKVGMEPTGDPFNSIVKLETVKPSKPLNPLINAGAIATISMIKETAKYTRVERIINFFKKITHNDALEINEEVYLSEKKTGNRNRSIAYFLKDLKIIDGDVEDVLDTYFRVCSINVSCVDLARIGLLLSNDGVDLKTKKRVIPKRYTKIAKSLMVTCGMYDESGAFAIECGVPAKSGVSGGILATAPSEYGIGVFSPTLNKSGNSVAGMRVLKELSNKLDLSIF